MTSICNAVKARPMLTNETSNVHVQQAAGQAKGKGQAKTIPYMRASDSCCANSCIQKASLNTLHRSVQPPDMCAWKPICHAHMSACSYAEGVVALLALLTASASWTTHGPRLGPVNAVLCVPLHV
jgi:hypothetical protein